MLVDFKGFSQALSTLKKQMFIELKIQHFILIEEAKIPFQKGLNVLSGETGSGKSAIMEAIKAILGFRQDSSVVRKGCEKAIVEAQLDIKGHSDLIYLLKQGGLDHDPNDDLVIRREISNQGKSRGYVNNQLVALSFLKQIGEALVTIAGQHANIQLQSPETHRQILDNYAGLNDRVLDFSKKWKEELKLIEEIEKLKANERARMRDLEICKMEVEEIENAHLKEGEEEELFTEYQLLSSSKERLEKATEVLQALQSEKIGLNHLKKQKTLLDQLASQDSKIRPFSELFNQAMLELEEVSHELRRYRDRLDMQPEKLQVLSDRLTLWNKLKKKYGTSHHEIAQYLKTVKEKEAFLENADEYGDELSIKLKTVHEENQAAMKAISNLRKAAAEKLQKVLTAELRELNMPKAELLIKLTHQEASSTGQESIEFFLKPNIGEQFFALKESASGGELSRMLLAIKTVLADKEFQQVFVFDEIDANIGGTTASIVGDKLRDLGKNHQVICITHFPQVAQKAHHHFQISKKEMKGRTFTEVVLLSDTEREKEFSRMLGSN